MNMYHGDGASHVPSYTTMEINAVAPRQSLLMHNTSGTHRDSSASPHVNTTSNLSLYDVAPPTYGGGQQHEGLLTHGRSSIHGPPGRRQSVAHSRLSLPTASAGPPVGNVFLTDHLSRPVQVPSDRQAGPLLHEPDKNKSSTAMDGAREHRSMMQEQDSGYRGPINNETAAPPSYTRD
jgi:hypothetical protein